MNINVSDYTFDALRGQTGTNRYGCPSLSYLISIVNSSTHNIAEILPAKRILTWLFDVEGQAINADHLKKRQQFFTRYFPGGFSPKTPCMVVEEWSPISAMLERGFEPTILRREPKFRALATGIWEPPAIPEEDIWAAVTDEGLFWALMGIISSSAIQEKQWINIIAQPGWDRASAVCSLPEWPAEEVEKAGRVVWKRTPEG